jgi:hypothetical protein
MAKVATGDRKWKKLLDDVVDVVKSIPKDEGIIFFTFKDRWSVNQGTMVCFADRLKAVLTDADVNITAKIDGKQGGKPLPRFVWMTHGNETSVSKYAYCSNVIFLGVLHKPDTALTADIYGQTETQFLIDPEKVKPVEYGEILSCFHQGFCRSSCRKVDGVNDDPKSGLYGMIKALTANIWVTHRDAKGYPIRDGIRKVMPGIKWKAWTPKHLKLDELKSQILNWLDGQEKAKVSTKLIKQGINRSPAKHDHPFSTALAKIDADPDTGWMKIGRSLHKEGYEDYGF